MDLTPDKVAKLKAMPTHVLVNKVTLTYFVFGSSIANKLRYQGQGVSIYVLMTKKHSGSPQLMLHAHGPPIL